MRRSAAYCYGRVKRYNRQPLLLFQMPWFQYFVANAPRKVEELLMDYSTCTRDAPSAPSDAKPMPSSNVQASFKSSKNMGPALWQRSEQNGTEICSLIFDIPNDIGPPVFMYYRMKEFYQNHRRYVQSLDLDQLKGIPVSNKSIKGGTCDPLTVDPDSGKAYYPCGLIANSIFNDTIPSPYRVGSNAEDYFMTNKGIAWDSDKQLMKNTEYKPWEVVPPPYWRARYGDHYTNETLPQINKDEEFMVWMRTAGLPHFSKLSRRNDTGTMSAGTYRLDIGDRMFWSVSLPGRRLTHNRLSSPPLQWYQRDSDIDAIHRRRQKPLHGNRVCGSWWHLRPHRVPLYHRASGET